MGGHSGRVGFGLATEWSWVLIPLRQLRFGTLAIPFTLRGQCLSKKTIKAVGPFYLVSISVYARRRQYKSSVPFIWCLSSSMPGEDNKSCRSLLSGVYLRLCQGKTMKAVGPFYLVSSPSMPGEDNKSRRSLLSGVYLRLCQGKTMKAVGPFYLVSRVRLCQEKQKIPQDSGGRPG